MTARDLAAVQKQTAGLGGHYDEPHMDRLRTNIEWVLEQESLQQDLASDSHETHYPAAYSDWDPQIDLNNPDDPDL